VSTLIPLTLSSGQIDAKRSIALVDLKQRELEECEEQKRELTKSFEESITALNQMKSVCSLSLPLCLSLPRS
jgi:hypothetical protein